MLPPAVATPLRTSSDGCACARRRGQTRPSCLGRAAGARLDLASPTLRLHDGQNDFPGRGINSSEVNEGAGIKQVTFEVVVVVVVVQRGEVLIVNKMYAQVVRSTVVAQEGDLLVEQHLQVPVILVALQRLNEERGRRTDLDLATLI